jgi:defect-in-organelle-trafficking protein DotC
MNKYSSGLVHGAFVIAVALATPTMALADGPGPIRGGSAGSHQARGAPPARPDDSVAPPDTAPTLAVTDVLSTELLHTQPEASRDNPNPLSRLLGLRRGDGVGSGDSKNDMNSIRTQAMREEGRRLGSQAALRWRYQIIVSVIEEYATSLSGAFNFGPLMIDQVVVPPVIGRIEKANRKYDDRTMRSVEVGYRLKHAARIVTTQPTWRNFLLRRYPRPERPPNVLLARNGKEVVIWQRAVRKGWRDGIDQANGNFKRSLNLLTSTYLGMLQYKVLLSERVVSRPNLATSGLRITSNGRKLNIGDRVYRITRDSEFTDSSRWEAVPTAPHDAR